MTAEIGSSSSPRRDWEHRGSPPAKVDTSREESATFTPRVMLWGPLLLLTVSLVGTAILTGQLVVVSIYLLVGISTCCWSWRWQPRRWHDYLAIAVPLTLGWLSHWAVSANPAPPASPLATAVWWLLPLAVASCWIAPAWQGRQVVQVFLYLSLLIASAEALRSRTTPVTFLLTASSWLALTLQLTSPGSTWLNLLDRSIKLSGRLPMVALGFFIPCGAAALSHELHQQWANQVGRWQAWLSDYSPESDTAHRVRGYVRVGSLDSVMDEKMSDPMQVALRVYADYRPGYLRGRVFDRYQNAQWQTSERRGNRWNRSRDQRFISPATLPSPGVSLSLDEKFFPLQPTGNPSQRLLEIQNDPQRGDVYFSPLEFNAVSGYGEFVAVDEALVVHAGLDRTRRYAYFWDHQPITQALTPAQQARWLELPAELLPEITQLVNRWPREARSAEQICNDVANFFQAEGEYSLEHVRSPANVDPLAYFLQQQPAAHCEFFASAAVLALRAQGVPARYVTGYVVTELEGEYGDYWLARNRNAHAWAEAYDSHRKRWIIVEATPGMARGIAENTPIRRPKSTRTLYQNGPSQQAWTTTWWMGAQTILRYTLLLVAITAAVAWCWSQQRLLQEWLRRCLPYQTNTATGRRYQWQRQFFQLCRRLRRCNLVRQRQETLHQFADRVASSPLARQRPWLTLASEELRKLANQRYRRNFP